MQTGFIGLGHPETPIAENSGNKDLINQFKPLLKDAGAQVFGNTEKIPATQMWESFVQIK